MSFLALASVTAMLTTLNESFPLYAHRMFPEKLFVKLSPGLAKYQLDAEAASSLAEIPVPSTESIFANFGASPLMRANDQPSIELLITSPVSESTAITEFMLMIKMMLEANLIHAILILTCKI